MIIAFSLIWMSGMIYLVTNSINEVDFSESFMDHGEELTQAKSMLDEHEHFDINDRFHINIYFGIEGYNERFYTKEGLSKWNQRTIGGPQFDPSFDIMEKDSQFYLLFFCNDLRNQDFVIKDSVKCWIEDFQKFVKGQWDSKRSRYYDLPLERRDFHQLFTMWRKIVPSGIDSIHQNTVSQVNSNILMFQIYAESVHNTTSFSANVKLNKQWKEFIANFKTVKATSGYVSVAQSGIASLFQTAGSSWTEMDVVEDWYKSSSRILIISAVCSFIIMILSLRDVIIVCIVFICQSFVIISVIGCVVLHNKHLSVLESFGLLVSLTLSANYSIQIGDGYLQSHQMSKSDKL